MLRSLLTRPAAKGRRRKKRKKKKATCTYRRFGPTYLPFLRFFEIFWSDFRNILMVFLGSSCRKNGQKRDKNKSMGKDERKKKCFFLNFFGQKFLTWISPKKFLWCF
jgi:hypothetical protein